MIPVIYACGFYNLALALFHCAFWRVFKWNHDLKKISFANRGIIQILNIQIIYIFIVVALICFLFPVELLSTEFGKIFLGANALFWLIRTIQQFVFLRADNYKIHILTVIFTAGTLLFAIPVLMS
jgi:hypothetical protein